MIEKPMGLKKKEFVQQILTVINQSKLPYFVVEYILHDFLNEFHNAVEQQNQYLENKFFDELDAQKQNQKDECKEDG